MEELVFVRDLRRGWRASHQWAEWPLWAAATANCPPPFRRGAARCARDQLRFRQEPKCTGRCLGERIGHLYIQCDRRQGKTKRERKHAIGLWRGRMGSLENCGSSL